VSENPKARLAEALNLALADDESQVLREQIRQLRREIHDMRRANEILKAASVFFATELDADRTR